MKNGIDREYCYGPAYFSVIPIVETTDAEKVAGFSK